MPLPRKRSIRTKLILLLTGTATATVVVACVMLWTYQFIRDRNSLRMEESSQAQLIADSSAAALLFRDTAAASETLSGLRADPRIELACLYDKEGKVLARYEVNGRNALPCPAGGTNAIQFTRRNLVIYRQIVLRSEPAGTLYLQVSLHDMYWSLLRFGQTVVAAVLLASAFAFVLASFLQRIISAPIRHLTQVATNVSQKGDYLVRAEPASSDETGVLIEQFNTMMDRIQQREEELRQAHSSLEDTVARRTQDLRNEILERKLIEQDLEAARIAAEEASRAKSAFLANMSHELRTPLNAIIGYSEMLLEDAEADGEGTAAEDLNKIVISARHLLTLISDVLDLSKIEAGQMKVSMEPVLASSLLQDVLATADILAKRNRNTLRIDSGLWEGQIFVDPFRFRQCLLNLLSNACKFTEDGTVSIAVRRQGDEVVWTVSDTGIGISPDNQENLFQTFTQADASTTRRYGGSGLGLAISQQLCRAMGGFIAVESRMGEGSIFSIHIPAMDKLIGPQGEPATATLKRMSFQPV